MVYNPTVQYIPRNLQGIIQCYIEANPPIQFVTWTRDSRIYDPYDVAGVMAMENGSILIDKVREKARTIDRKGGILCHSTGQTDFKQ